jgi:inosose dehydratase
MKATMNRRQFTKVVALGAAAAAVAAPSLWAADEPTRKLKIGHTGITFNVWPGAAGNANLEGFVRDIASLGFTNGFECFPETLEAWDERGTLSDLIAKYKLPLTSAYTSPNVVDSTKRKDNLALVIKHAKIVKKYGGKFLVLAAGGNRGKNYDFDAVRQNIIESFNEYGAAITDIGIGAGLHQHTGTPVDKRDEVYAVMEKVDTKVFKFAPDVGQLQKAGADAAKVVKDFLPIVVHMHLKDFCGWKYYGGYCPLNQGKMDVKPLLQREDIPYDELKANPGKVEIKAILDMVEVANPDADIMIELDPGGPLTALETARCSKAYLQSLGYKFLA